MRLVHPARVIQKLRQRRVGGGELVIMDLQSARIVEASRPEVARAHQRHVADAAPGCGRRRVVERLREIARYAAQEVGVVVVLPAHPLVVVQLLGQVDLVTGGAELGAAMQVLQERLLVERRLALHQLPVHPSQDRVVAEREGVVQGFLDREVGVAAGRIDVGDRVAGRAGDAGAREGVLANVVVGVVEPGALEGPREERYRVVAARAPAGGLHVAIALHADVPGLAHREQVRRVAERAEAMGAVVPLLVGVAVALPAIGIHHQRSGRNEIAGGGARQRRGVILRSGRGSLLIPVPRVLRLDQQHDTGKRRRERSPSPSELPVDPLAGQTVQHVEPRQRKRRYHVHPVGAVAQHRILQVEEAEAGQRDSRQQQHERRGKERDPGADRAPVGSLPRIAEMQGTEDEYRNDDQEPEHQVQQKHDLVEVVLQRLAGPPFEPGDRAQVDRVDGEQREQREDGEQEPSEPRSDGRNVADPGAIGRTCRDGVLRSHPACSSLFDCRDPDPDPHRLAAGSKPRVVLVVEPVATRAILSRHRQRADRIAVAGVQIHVLGPPVRLENEAP